MRYGVRAWLGRIFDPPVTQRHFDRAMAEQTEAIREVGDQGVAGQRPSRCCCQATGNRVVAAVQQGNAEILALVSDMKRSVSEVSDGSRAPRRSAFKRCSRFRATGRRCRLTSSLTSGERTASEQSQTASLQRDDASANQQQATGCNPSQQACAPLKGFHHKPPLAGMVT